jgi:DNA-binding NarL/FixJ family response regulator
MISISKRINILNSFTQTNEDSGDHIRVLIFTTFQDSKQARDLLRNGADGFLLKTTEPLELANKIRIIHRGDTLIEQGMSRKIFEKLDESSALPQSKTADTYDLTPREIEILQLVAKGHRYKTIASKLYLSVGTVRNCACSPKRSSSLNGIIQFFSNIFIL